MHSFDNGEAVMKKRDNWEQLQRLFKARDFYVDASLIEGIIQSDEGTAKGRTGQDDDPVRFKPRQNKAGFSDKVQAMATMKPMLEEVKDKEKDKVKDGGKDNGKDKERTVELERQQRREEASEKQQGQ
eukprot:gene1926-6800_t